MQGKEAGSARKIIEHAQALQDRGCFSIVLECIPVEIARLITKKLRIPTIGIGAGVHCDGQVLVTYDLLGFVGRFKPKFVKQYANLNDSILSALRQFRREVLQEQFPDPNHSYNMEQREWDQINIPR